MQIDPIVPAQVAAACQFDRCTAVQARVTKAQRPAQVALAGGGFIVAMKVVMHVADVGVELGEVIAQGRQPFYPVQWVLEEHIVAVEPVEFGQTAGVQFGERVGETLEKGRHVRLRKLYMVVFLYKYSERTA